MGEPFMDSSYGFAIVESGSMLMLIRSVNNRY